MDLDETGTATSLFGAFLAPRPRYFAAVNHFSVTWQILRQNKCGSHTRGYHSFSPPKLRVRSHAHSFFRALSIQPNIPELSKRGKMVGKFPLKVSGKTKNC